MCILLLCENVVHQLKNPAVQPCHGICTRHTKLSYSLQTLDLEHRNFVCIHLARSASGVMDMRTTHAGMETIGDFLSRCKGVALGCQSPSCPAGEGDCSPVGLRNLGNVSPSQACTCRVVGRDEDDRSSLSQMTWGIKQVGSTFGDCGPVRYRLSIYRTDQSKIIHAMQYVRYQIPINLPKLQKIVMHPTGRIPI
jgi:hypothetical protein